VTQQLICSHVRHTQAFQHGLRSFLGFVVLLRRDSEIGDRYVALPSAHAKDDHFGIACRVLGPGCHYPKELQRIRFEALRDKRVRANEREAAWDGNLFGPGFGRFADVTILKKASAFFAREMK
jgi:hypothetical protein